MVRHGALIGTVEDRIFKLSKGPADNVTMSREGFTRNGPLILDPEGVARLTFL